MAATLRKRSLVVKGHKTSVSLENEFFDDLVATARSRGLTLSQLVAQIDDARPAGVNLSSAIRLHLFSARKPVVEVVAGGVV